MGDKIVKSKNLCCQPVVFPSLSLLRNFSESLLIVLTISCYKMIRLVRFKQIFYREFHRSVKKDSKVTAQNFHRLLAILAIYDFLVRFILHKCYECLFWSYNIGRNFTYFRDAISGWAGKVFAHPEFGSWVNPITTKGADYAHRITACPPRFENLTVFSN